MNVASLELCKELYELSGWTHPEDQLKWWNFSDDVPLEMVGMKVERSWFLQEGDGYGARCPAYDLGYLLRKLNDDRHLIEVYNVHGMNWRAKWENDISLNAQTPEDAACKLAVELFRQGVLTPAQSTKKEEENGL